MPARNSVKQYLAGGYYHIYNRGVEKRIIFQDQQDYAVFISYLKAYLLPKDEKSLREQLSNPNIDFREKDHILKLLRLNNFSEEITLLAYCLMPNHFHLLLKQKSENGIDKFMNSLCTRYTMYFNRKNKRVGFLYQDVYKAVLVTSDPHLLHLSRYIHRNPVSRSLQGDPLRTQIVSQPSSYLDYLGKKKTAWVKPEEILAHFSKRNPKLTYQAFVELSEDLDIIKDVAIDL